MIRFYSHHYDVRPLPQDQIRRVRAERRADRGYSVELITKLDALPLIYRYEWLPSSGYCIRATSLLAALFNR
jgi:hypothetical protein